MARIRGCAGKVYAKDLAATGAATRAYEITGYEWETDTAVEDGSQIGDCTRVDTPGRQQTTGTLNLNYDPAATSNQLDLFSGNLVSLEIYPEGDGSGARYYQTPTGGALVNNEAHAGGLDGAATMTINFRVQGVFATAAVP